MGKISVPIDRVDREYLGQLEYALTFASEDITSFRIDEERSVVDAEVSDGAAVEPVIEKIRELAERYALRDLAALQGVHFRQDRELSAIDAWTGLQERRWVTPVGQGHVILRGPAAKLMSLIDRKVSDLFAALFKAELEIYPPTIKCETLDRCQHFTSFPEHIDFVGHLKSDLSVLNHFASECREKGWQPVLHEGTMANNDFAMQPFCSQGHRLRRDGRRGRWMVPDVA